MGRKKSKSDKNPGNTSGKQRNLKMIAVFMGVISIALAGVYFGTKPDQPKVASVPATAFGKLIEKRPVLSHKMFTGKAARAYQIAAEIPKVIDGQFCYCYCKKDHGHKTLLTCFTNNHGAKCDVCMDEVLYAYELYQEGLSMDEIVEKMDEKFYRPYRGHRL